MRTRFLYFSALLALVFGLAAPTFAQEAPIESEPAGGAERFEAPTPEGEETGATYAVSAPADPSKEKPASSGLSQSDFNKMMKSYESDKKKADEAKKKEDEAAGYEVGKDLGMTATWKNGVEIQTKDKAFRLHIGGRTQFDGSAFAASNNIQHNAVPGLTGGNPFPGNFINTPYTNGVDFRRARFRMDGTMYENIDFAMEYDFVNSNSYLLNDFPTSTGTTAGSVAVFPQNPLPTNVTALTDMWWTFKNLPTVGNIRVGNQKEAIGMEHMTSSRFLPFMERSYNQDAFYGGSFNGFIPGISAFNTFADERATWNIGLYKPAINVFSYNNINNDYAVTGRLTALPWYVDDGRGLLHLGFSASDRTGYNGVYRYRTRDAIRSGISSTWPIPADTGNFLMSRQQWLNTEVAMVRGPFTMQAEYLVDFSENVRKLTTVNNVVAGAPGGTISSTTTAGPNLGTAIYHGGYIQMLYFLTGESDNYSKERAAFDRVTPFENFFLMPGESGNVFGRGAWQVGARYNYLNLNSEGLNGGILHNFSGTLNWYLNPNMKVQFDYMATYRIADLNATKNGTGWVNGIGARIAHDW